MDSFFEADPKLQTSDNNPIIFIFLTNSQTGPLQRTGILRKIAEGETNNLGDTTTLLDPAVVEEIKDNRIK